MPPSRVLIPPKGSNAGVLRDFLDRQINRESVYRARNMERMALNLFYYYGRQWIEPDTQVDPLRGFTFRDTYAGGYEEMPRPISNHCAPAVENEVARLGKLELRPDVRPDSNDPKLESAARTSKDVLLHRLDEERWPEVRDLGTLVFVVCGTLTYRSWWDQNIYNLSMVVAPEAVQCSNPECDFRLATPTIDRETLNDIDTETKEERTTEIPATEPGEDSTFLVNSCLQCQQPTPMVQSSLTLEDAQARPDTFGRPLHSFTPRGDTAQDLVVPFDYYPPNGGLGVDPHTCRAHYQETPRDMDWIDARFENGQEVQPENPQEIMRWHPVMGEWGYLGWYNVDADRGIFDNHALVREAHLDPTLDHPRGRSIIMAGDVVLLDDDLMIGFEDDSGKTRYVKRVSYDSARYKTRVGEFWGLGIMDDIVSPQNRVNGIDAQIIEARERMGSPNLLVTEGMELRGPEWFNDYGAGKMMTYALDAGNPQAKPEVFGSVLMPEGVYQERQNCIEDLRIIAGNVDVQLGNAPKNISTTSGIQLLNEQANERRGPRARALTGLYERQWSHKLELIWALRREPAYYEVEGKNGKWETRQFLGTDLLGQTRVKIQAEGTYDSKFYQREAAREAQADQLYTVDSPLARYRLLKLRGLPTDVNEEQNLQITRADQEWVDFRDKGIVPVIDTTLDDHSIRFQALGKYLLTDDGIDMRDAVGFPAILRTIVGWDEELAKLEAVDGMMTGAQMPLLMPQQQQEIQQKAAEVGWAGPLPKPLEERILMVWGRMIEQAGIAITAPLEKFLAFRAVVEAHRLYAERATAAQMMGVPGAGAGAPPPGGSPAMEPGPAAGAASAGGGAPPPVQPVQPPAGVAA
jgi:hypothetical protein